MTPDPKDPFARALELVDRMERDGTKRLDDYVTSLCIDLRAAIRAMGEALLEKGRDLSEARFEKDVANDALTLMASRRPVRTHSWVPLAECGELADGHWVTWMSQLGLGLVERKDGEWQQFYDFHHETVTHVLSPHLGPIPEVNRG